MSAIVSLANSHSIGFVALAASICTLMAILVIGFSERARALSGRRRLCWLAAVAAIAGFGVWATHFVAVIGYRPAVLWSFRLDVTALSALLSILLTGVPLALAALMRRRVGMMACGTAAGLGIGAMHYTGMAALSGCVATHGPETVALSLAFGAGFGSLAFAFRPAGWRFGAAAAMLVLAVCFLHFTAVAGLEVRLPTVGGEPGGPVISGDSLAVAVAAVALLLILVALMAAAYQARLDLQNARQAGLLAAEAARLSDALQNMSNGLVVVGADERVTLHNDRARQLLHLQPGEIAEGMTLATFLGHVGRRNGWDEGQVARAVESHRHWMGQDEIVRVEQHFPCARVVRVSCRPQRGGAIIAFEDATSEHRTQSRMAHMAHHDALTGLPNRRAFHAHLEAAAAEGRDVALLVLDLDQFKEINDTLGHGAGDRVLIDAAERLGAVCGPGDFLARLGGDELAVVHERTCLESDARLAERMIEAIGGCRMGSEAGLKVGCSIGIAASGDAAAGEADMTGAELMMRQADLALYRAKETGRGCFRRFEPEMLEAVARRRRMEQDIAAALRTGAFSLAFQPLLDIAGMRTVGFEALLRWTHPERGPVSPAEFVPLAERTGQIVALGDFVLAEACRQAALWPEGIHVAVNVSPVQLRVPGFPLRVAAALAAHGLHPSRLEIELTETAIVEDGREIAASLKALRSLGVSVAMDDFGTGYSSLAHLSAFELDRIKIDRSFVAAAPSDPGSLAVMRAIAGLGRDLGVRTLGEGVETPEQLRLLAEAGCDGVQGYLTGRPMPAERIADFLAAEGPPSPADSGRAAA